MAFGWLQKGAEPSYAKKLSHYSHPALNEA